MYRGPRNSTTTALNLFHFILKGAGCDMNDEGHATGTSTCDGGWLKKVDTTIKARRVPQAKAVLKIPAGEDLGKLQSVEGIEDVAFTFNAGVYDPDENKLLFKSKFYVALARGPTTGEEVTVFISRKTLTVKGSIREDRSLIKLDLENKLRKRSTSTSGSCAK